MTAFWTLIWSLIVVTFYYEKDWGILFMKLLKTEHEVIMQISESKLQPPNKLTSTKYSDKVVFECGCGKSHKVNDPSNRIFSVAVPVKFVIDCENGYVTFFQVKGFFKQTVTSIWSTKATVFTKALERLGL